ncbi:hypothetical protein H1R20_g10227, partial [Candolleomyces eurysporus]
MHLSTNFVLLGLLAQGWTAFSLPVDVTDETSLISRDVEPDAPEFQARDFGLDARFLDDIDAGTLDARDWEDIIDSIDLRSISEEELAALEARGLKIGGIAKSSSGGKKAAASTKSKKASSKSSSSPKPKKKSKETSSGKKSASGGGKKSSGKKDSSSGKSKKSKKQDPPSRTRSRTFNVNIDPGNMINAAANIAGQFLGN